MVPVSKEAKRDERRSISRERGEKTLKKIKNVQVREVQIVMVDE